MLKSQNRKKIDQIINVQKEKWGVRVYRYENVGNHIHILLRVSHRKQLNGFLRSLSGLIARAVLGVERGSGKGVKFWDARPFSRIVRWGKAYKHVQMYFDKNKLEAIGFNFGPHIKIDRTSSNTS